VADEIRVAVSTAQLEVPVLGCQPRIDDLRDLDAAVSQNQHARRLLTAMTCIAFNTDREEPVFVHGAPGER